jgi:CheY-like chemotaxis protein
MLKILILEDNEGRRSAMQSCLLDRFHQYESIFFADANEMLAYLDANLRDALLISLDHDLEMLDAKNGNLTDPGTGRMVADYLANKSPSCPVIVATTNSHAGDGMEFLLRDADWDVHRVHPYGDTEWISTAWFKTVRKAIVASAKPRKEMEVRKR